MSKKDLDLILERVAERYDPDYLVDILEIDSEELLEAFPEKFIRAIDTGNFIEVMDDDESL